jgi:hypothetical protein
MNLKLLFTDVDGVLNRFSEEHHTFFLFSPPPMPDSHPSLLSPEPRNYHAPLSPRRPSRFAALGTGVPMCGLWIRKLPHLSFSQKSATLNRL